MPNNPTSLFGVIRTPEYTVQCIKRAVYTAANNVQCVCVGGGGGLGGVPACRTCTHSVPARASPLLPRPSNSLPSHLLSDEMVTHGFQFSRRSKPIQTLWAKNRPGSRNGLGGVPCDDRVCLGLKRAKTETDVQNASIHHMSPRERHVSP